jgi:tetratricopeptide (TPR) repeat protein
LHQRSVINVAVGLILLISGRLGVPQQPIGPGPTAAPSVESHLSKGYDALKEDRYDEAVQEFRAALAMDSTLVLRARFPLAVALFESHKTDEARGELEAVRQEVGDHPNVLYYLGRADIEKLNFAAAIQELKKAAAKPPFPDTAYYLGYAYFKQGDLVNAEKWLEQAERLTPSDSRIPYQLGFLYRKQGLEQKAKQSLALSQRLRQRDANESRIKSECEAKLEQGPREAARALCDQLYDPDNPEKLTALGTIYGKHGDLAAALKPLKRAAELAPQAPQMQYNLALTYFQLNQLEDAKRPLSTAVQRWPDLFSLNRLYGAVLMKSGDLPSAYETLHHAHQLDSQDRDTIEMLYATSLDLARRMRNNRQYSESLRILEEAAKLKPQDPEPHRRLADVYQLAGRPAEAKAEQEKAEQLAKTTG